MRPDWKRSWQCIKHLMCWLVNAKSWKMTVIMSIISLCYLEYKSSFIIINVLVQRTWPALLHWKSTLLCCLRTISSELIICIGFYLLGLRGLSLRICFITVSLASGVSFLQSSVLGTKQAFYAMESERRGETFFCQIIMPQYLPPNMLQCHSSLCCRAEVK